MVIKRCMIVMQIDGSRYFDNMDIEEQVYASSLVQNITNIVELDKLLENGVIPKYLYKTRNIASHSYEQIDFDIVWRFISKDLDRLVIDIDNSVNKYK